MNSYSRLPVVISPRGSPRGSPRKTFNQPPGPIVYLPISPIKMQPGSNRLSFNDLSPLMHPPRPQPQLQAQYEYIEYSSYQIPNRQPYLDQNDSELYPSELPYYRLNTSNKYLHLNISRSSNGQHMSFSNPADMTFEPHNVHNNHEQLPPPMTRQEKEEYEECVREIQFRKRIDSIDRWLDEKKEEFKDRPDGRDFLREFDLIVCTRF